MTKTAKKNRQGLIDNINVLIGVLGTIFFFLIPVLCSSDTDNDDSDLHTSLSSQSVRESGIALLVAGCPLILDLLMDAISHSKNSLKFQQYFCNRIVIAISTILIGIQIIYFIFQIFRMMVVIGLVYEVIN